MEQSQSSTGEDTAATDKEEVKDAREKEDTGDEAKTSTSSSFGSSPMSSSAVNLHAAPSPPRKEKIKDQEKKHEKKQHHPFNGSPGPSHKILTHDTITAWEKKPPSKGGRRVRPPRYSRLLSSLSEEHLASQISEVALEHPEEELVDLVPRSSLQEHLAGQNNGTPVDFSAPSVQPQEIPAVETVETEPKSLDDEVPSTSRDAEAPSAQASDSTIEPKKEDSSFAAFRRPAAVHGVHSKVELSRDSISSTTDRSPSIWNMGQRISHWKLAHQRGYHIDQLTQDKNLKNTIMKFERESKAAVPLPLQEVIEEEALEILKVTLKDYQKYLGGNHQLTQQLEERAEKLHLRLKGRGVIE